MAVKPASGPAGLEAHWKAGRVQSTAAAPRSDLVRPGGAQGAGVISRPPVSPPPPCHTLCSHTRGPLVKVGELRLAGHMPRGPPPLPPSLPPFLPISLGPLSPSLSRAGARTRGAGGEGGEGGGGSGWGGRGCGCGSHLGSRYFPRADHFDG